MGAHDTHSVSRCSSRSCALRSDTEKSARTTSDTTFQFFVLLYLPEGRMFWPREMIATIGVTRSRSVDPPNSSFRAPACLVGTRSEQSPEQRAQLDHRLVLFTMTAVASCILSLHDGVVERAPPARVDLRRVPAQAK